MVREILGADLDVESSDGISVRGAARHFLEAQHSPESSAGPIPHCRITIGSTFMATMRSTKELAPNAALAAASSSVDGATLGCRA